ncbi:hypothetical protein [Helicobacter pylori]|nr:hypothetical protein [Helicobacter pylori]
MYNNGFGVRVFAFNANAFFTDENHQTNSSFSMLVSIYYSLIRVEQYLTK